jgi:CDP-4-dehydro-6-deoxyglucose reductase, E3
MKTNQPSDVVTKKVTIIPEDIELSVSKDESILDAALKQKLNLPHGCKNGDCGACKCKVVSGEITLEAYNKAVLTDEELDQGYTLLCKAHPQSEVILDIPNLLNSFPIKTLPAKVEKIEKMGDVAIITIKLPFNQLFGFYAGQYIEIMLNGKNRCYSIANNPNEESIVEIHVRYYMGGVFSEFVWNELKEKQILRFKGPLGSFQLSDHNDKPTIFICTGTGFAPIKAMLQDMLAKNIKRNLHVYWGNRTVNDFYLLDELRNLQHKLNFKLTLCTSRESIGDFTYGYVTTAFINDFSDLHDYEIYACGNLKMIEDAYKQANKECGLDKKNFFSDAFTPSV